MKRSARHVEDEEEEDAEASGLSTAEEEDASVEDDRRADQRSAKRRTVASDDDDDDNGVDQDEDMLDDEMRSEALDFSQSQGGGNGRSGVIEDLEIHNFLCHTFLHIKFGPQVNFITGRNGSGKSAILAAIIVCLGGKASFTNRGSSMKELVKKGEQLARLTIGIRNVGEEAYRPDSYGSVIYVERTIARDGPATLRLLKCTNPQAEVAKRRFEVVSKSRDDLSAIIEHFAILLENPLAILTQDTAKAFLNSSAPADKYKMFLKGTQLESINQNFGIIRERMQLIRATHSQKLRDLDVIRAARLTAEARARELERLRDLEEEIGMLEKQCAWSLVAEQEENLAEAQQKLDDRKKARAAAEPELAEAEQRYAEAEANKTAVATRLDELSAERAPLTTELRRRQDVHKGLVSERKNLASDLQSADSDIKRLRKELDRAKADIDAEVRRVEEGAAGKARARRAERRAQVEQELDRLGHEVGENTRLQTDGEERVRQLTEQTREQQSQQSVLRSAADRARRAQQEISAASQNRLAAFGQNLPRVMPVIERMIKERRFRGEVVGPLGKFVTLREPKWGRAVSAVLRTAVRAFVVTNYEDLNLLRRTFREHKCDQPVYKYETQARYDVTRNMPDPSQFTSILSVLEISHPTAFNAIVDIAKAERNILVADHAQGTAILHRRPANVLNVILEDGARMSISRNGMLSHRSEERGGGGAQANWFEDTALLQRRAEEDAARAQGDLHRLEEHMNALADEANTVKRRLATLVSEQRALQKKQFSLEREHASLVDDLADRDDSGSLLALKDVRTDIENKLQVLHAQYADINASYEAKQAEVQPAQEAVKEQDAVVAAHDRLQGEVRADHERLARASADILRAIDKFRERLHRADESIREGEAQARTQSDALDDLLERATRISAERPPLQKTYAAYSEALRRCKELLKRKEKEHGTLKDARERHANLLAEEKRVATALELSEQLVNLFGHAMENRQVMWLMNRAFMSMRSKSLFTHIVEHRGFQGIMNIDHDKQIIDMKVSKDGALRATHQLSGGERSFSTMAFLLSLWESLDSPFRALDEYDVFMDEVNRKLSTQLIIDTARMTASKQFILISPLETYVEDICGCCFLTLMCRHAPLNAPDVHVVRLADPVRDTA